MHLIPSGIRGTQYCIGVKDDNPELLNRINEGLLRLKRNGQYEKIYNKWFNAHTLSSEQWWWIIGTFSVLALLFIAFWIIAHRKVKRATRNLRELNEKLTVSLQKYDAVFDSMIVGVEFYDKTGTLVDLNTKAMSLYGFTDSKRKILARRLNCYDNPNIPVELVDKLIGGESFVGVIQYDFDKVKEA